MGVIVDTSIWIEVERRNLTHLQVVEAVENDDAYIAPPIIAELEYGVNRAKTPSQRNRRFAAVEKIKMKPCLVIDKRTATIFGRLAADLDAVGKPTTHRAHDVWIAALAIQHNMRVLTQNAKDFIDIPGVELIEI